MLQKRELSGLAKVYWDAAQYIRVHGWCQGSVRKGAAVCIHGAFHDTVRCGSDGWLATELNAVTDAFIRLVGTTPAYWNDIPGRTKHEVVAQLEEIAWKLADEQDGCRNGEVGDAAET